MCLYEHLADHNSNSRRHTVYLKWIPISPWRIWLLEVFRKTHNMLALCISRVPRTYILFCASKDSRNIRSCFFIAPVYLFLIPSVCACAACGVYRLSMPIGIKEFRHCCHFGCIPLNRIKQKAVCTPSAHISMKQTRTAPITSLLTVITYS